MKRIVIAVLLLAALTLPAQAQQTPFPDIPAGHWAAEAVAEITRLGIIVGFPDGSFRGNENLTRYQAALIIQRVLNVVGNGGPAVDLSSLRNAIQELSADLSALNVRVTQIEMDRGALEQLRQTVAALQSAQADFVTRPEFNELRNAVAALAGPVSQEDLARLQQAIEALRVAGVSPGDIAALSQAVAQLQQTAVTADDLARVQDIAVEARATALQALAAVEALRTRPVDPGMDEAALVDLSARVEANSVAVETALARTRSLAAAIDEIRAQMGLAPVELDAMDPVEMEAQFLGLRAQLEATQQDVMGLSNLIITLNNESISQGQRLTDLDGRVRALEARAEMVSPVVPALPDDPTAVGALEDQVAAVRDFVILVRRDVVGLSDRVAGVESVVAQTAEDVSALQERLAKLEAAGDLGDLQGRVAALEGQVLKLSGSIAVRFNNTRVYASPAFDLTRFDVDRLNVDGNVQSAFSAGDTDGDGSFTNDLDSFDEARLRSILTLSANFAKQGRSSGGLNVHDISVTFNAVSMTHAGDPVGLYPTGNQGIVLWTIARFTATFTINGQPFQVMVGVQPSVKFTEYVFDNDTPTAATRGLRGWRGEGGEGVRFSAPAIDLGLPVVPGFTFFLGKVSANDVATGTAPVVGPPSTFPAAAPWVVYAVRPSLDLFGVINVGFNWVEIYEDDLYGNSIAAAPWYHKVAGADATIDLDILVIKGEFAEAHSGQYIDQATKDPLPLTWLGNLAYLTARVDLGFVTVNANYRWLTPSYDGVSGDLGAGNLNYGNNTYNAAPFRLNQYGFGANATVTLGDDFLKVVGGYDQATEFDGTVNGRGHFKFEPSTANELSRTSFGAQATIRLAAIVLTAHVVSDAEAVGAADFGTDFQIRASVGHDGAQANPFIPGLTINAHYQSDSWTGSVWTNEFGRTDMGVSASFQISLLGGTITPRASYSMVSYAKDGAGDQVDSGNPAITLGVGNRTLNPLLGFTATIDPRQNPANATFGTDSTTLSFGATVRMPLAFLPMETSIAFSADYFSRNQRAIGAGLTMADGRDQTELRFLAGVDFGQFLFANSKLAVRAGWIDIGNTQVGAGPADLGETRYGYWLTWTYWDVSLSYGAFSYLLKGTDPTPVDDIWTWYDGWRISYTVNF